MDITGTITLTLRTLWTTPPTDPNAHSVIKMHVDGKRFETEGNVKKSASSSQTDCTKMSSLPGEEALCHDGMT